MDNATITAIVTCLITGLLSAGGWKFYETVLKSRAAARKEEKMERLAYRDDLIARVDKLETERGHYMEALTILKTEVAALTMKITYIELQTIYSMYEYNAKLDRVVDGDTVDAMIDLGFDTWVHKRIRLEGIDAPETRTRDLDEKAQGFKTKERLEGLLEAADGVFVLQSHGVGKYGRCLGTIFIGQSGKLLVNINELLLHEGLAEEYK